MSGGSRAAQRAYTPPAAMAWRNHPGAPPLRLAVHGRSMAPTLLPGDVIHVDRLAGSGPRVGDLLVVARGDGLTVHRLVAVGHGRWTTKGDNARQVDPPLAPGDVIGRAAAVERGGRVLPIEEPGRGAAMVARCSLAQARAHRLTLGGVPLLRRTGVTRLAGHLGAAALAAICRLAAARRLHGTR